MDLIGQRDGGQGNGEQPDAAARDGHDRDGAPAARAGATILAFPAHRVKAQPGGGSAGKDGAGRGGASGAALESGTLSLPFPLRQATLFEFPVRPDAGDVTARMTAALIAMALENTPRKTPTPSTLAVLGGIAGFAAQQSLMLRGNPYWGQPMRAAHLDRMLISDKSEHASLWLRVREMALSMGQTRLPDPGRLLVATQKCVGTNQLGVITLPPQHRLTEQPQTGVTRLWARVRSALDDQKVEPYLWPGIAARAAAEQLALSGGKVPIHVAVRITMQAALGMALIEPKQIPGAALRSA